MPVKNQSKPLMRSSIDGGNIEKITADIAKAKRVIKISNKLFEASKKRSEKRVNQGSGEKQSPSLTICNIQTIFKNHNSPTPRLPKPLNLESKFENLASLEDLKKNIVDIKKKVSEVIFYLENVQFENKVKIISDLKYLIYSAEVCFSKKEYNQAKQKSKKALNISMVTISKVEKQYLGR